VVWLWEDLNINIRIVNQHFSYHIFVIIVTYYNYLFFHKHQYSKENQKWNDFTQENQNLSFKRKIFSYSLLII